jgi:probable HAF family extracellular repeat protein
MMPLGVLPGGSFSQANGVSADGSVVVGTSDSANGYQAFIWDAADGMRSLQDLLGVGGWKLTSATAVSADGTTIVGTGIDPQGEQEGWVATVGRTAAASIVAPTQLSHDAVHGGVDLAYAIGEAALSQATSVALFWASGPHDANAVGGPIPGTSQSLPAGTAVGSYGPIYISNATLGPPPAGATYLLAVADPNDLLGNFSEAQNVLALPISSELSTTSLTTSVAESTWGRGVTFTATVTPNLSGSGTPTGTVTFFDGTTALGTGTLQLTNGIDQATYATSTLQPGGHTITAVYSGDTNFLESSSAGLSQQVDKAKPTITWANPADIAYGTPLDRSTQLDAVASFSGQPLAGQYSYTPAGGVVLHAGQGQVLSVIFTPDDQTHYQTVQQTATINVTSVPLTITANNQTMVSGQPVPALTASYSGFVNGDSPASLTTQPVLTTTATSGSPPGTYPITVSGAQDPDYTITYVNGVLTVTPPVVIGPVATTTTVSSSAAESVWGQSVTFTATVAPIAGAFGTPTGTVTFFDGTTAIGTGMLQFTNQMDQATYATSSLEPGSHALTAVYGGDSNFLPSTSAAITQLVDKATPVITWPSPADIRYGTKLGDAQLDAQASVPGEFTYIPGTGFVFHAGQHQLNAFFVPQDADHYNFVPEVTTTINVTPAPLTIAANNQVMVTGRSVPPLTASYSGFVNGDSPASLNPPPTLTTTATPSSPVGPYPILVAGAQDPDYAISYLPGTLTVLPPPVSSVNLLAARQASDTFLVPVTFSDPVGIYSVDLYVSVNGGAFKLAQTLAANSGVSGTLNFPFTGFDRNTYAFHSLAHDVFGNAESKSSTLIEASTYVPDLNPPVTHTLASNASYSWSPFPAPVFGGLPASSYGNGVFTLNWAGADPDQLTGGTIASLSIYEQIDGGTPTLVGTVTPASPAAVVSGGTTYYLYSASMICSALGDGQAHTYSFYSLGTDDLGNEQAVPSAADVTFSGIAYVAPLSATLSLEKGLSERSYVRYLDVTFNQTVSTSFQMQDLQNGLAGSHAAAFVQLLWWGGNLTASSTSQGSVNLFGSGTTAQVSLSGNVLSIDFGANGITSLLTESSVSGTGSPKTTFGDGWYALAIDPYGDPSQNIVLWLPFFRLLGDVNGDGQVTGPTTTAGTDAYLVNQARGQSGSLLNADVNGDGAVNSTDLQEAVAAANAHDKVGSTAPQTFPQFQLLAGRGASAAAATVTEAQVQAVLPEAIAAWQSAGLDPAGVQALRQVQIQIANLGTSILGLENPGVIQLNRTAAGQGWDVAGGSVSLLTVLEHELGHVVGLGDNAVPGDLMNITLAPGILRAPTPADVTQTALGAGLLTPPTAPTELTVPPATAAAMLPDGSPTPFVSAAAPTSSAVGLVSSGALLDVSATGVGQLPALVDRPAASALYQGNDAGAVLVAGAGDELLIGDSGRDRLVGGFVSTPLDDPAGRGDTSVAAGPSDLAGAVLASSANDTALWDPTTGFGTDDAVWQLAYILTGAGNGVEA